MKNQTTGAEWSRHSQLAWYGQPIWGRMNNGFEYNHPRVAWLMKNPPPGERIFENTASQFMELRGSWIFKHPPPCPVKQGYKKLQNIYGTKERRPRGLGPPPRGVPCSGLDPEKLAGGTGYLQDLRQPDMEWIRPARAEDTPPSGRTWIRSQLADIRSTDDG